MLFLLWRRTFPVCFALFKVLLRLGEWEDGWKEFPDYSATSKQATGNCNHKEVFAANFQQLLTNKLGNTNLPHIAKFSDWSLGLILGKRKGTLWTGWWSVKILLVLLKKNNNNNSKTLTLSLADTLTHTNNHLGTSIYGLYESSVRPL